MVTTGRFALENNQFLILTLLPFPSIISRTKIGICVIQTNNVWYSFANEWYLSGIDSHTKFAAVQLLIVAAVPLPYTQYQLHLLDVVFLVVLQVF